MHVLLLGDDRQRRSRHPLQEQKAADEVSVCQGFGTRQCPITPRKNNALKTQQHYFDVMCNKVRMQEERRRNELFYA